MAKKLHKWRVIKIKSSPAHVIGTVEATDADAAIKQAIKEYEIEPDVRKRLAAYQVS